MMTRSIEARLRALGLNGCYQGYRCLVHAVLLAADDPGILDQPTKQLYPQVGKLCALTPSGAESALRNAVQACFRRCPDQVETLCSVSGEPSVPVFISALLRTVKVT